MIWISFYIFFCTFLIGEALSFMNVYPRLNMMVSPHKNTGDPLILTPFIKKNDIRKAQKLSRVPLTAKLGIVSHAGFITVNELYQSNMFFWYFPSFSKKKDSPVVTWLQGGPGASSLFGLFAELGPLVPQDDGIEAREYHWALHNHLIFIDNPVGTGFSFTKDNRGYCYNESCIAKNLYNFLQQFFTLFPDLRKNDFYITGESYAGKYVPHLGMEIHKQNNEGNDSKINLKGLAMGNAYSDPINQLNYGSYLYQHGLLDMIQYNMFEDLQQEIKKAINKKQWVMANLLMDKLLEGEISNVCYFKNFTGFKNYYNILNPDEEDFFLFKKMLKDDCLRKSVHIGGVIFDDGDKVRLYLALDILKSVASVVTELLSHYRILFYNGQLDIVVAYPLTVNFLRNLNFDGAEDYKHAKRIIWKVDDEIAGYVKKAGNLTEILVRNAGHMVPRDQPKWALDMITKFIRGKF